MLLILLILAHLVNLIVVLITSCRNVVMLNIVLWVIVEHIHLGHGDCIPVHCLSNPLVLAISGVITFELPVRLFWHTMAIVWSQYLTVKI